MVTKSVTGEVDESCKLEMRGGAVAGNSPREAFWQYPGDLYQHHTPVDTLKCIV